MSTNLPSDPLQPKTSAASYDDLPSLMELQFIACEGDPFHRAIWGANSLANRTSAASRLESKWKRQSSTMHVWKCCDVNTSQVLAFCVWEVFTQSRLPIEYAAEDEMTSCSWLQEGPERELGRAYLIPAVHKRGDIMGGQPYALLTNLCTHPDHRNRGAARILVKSGTALADQLGIPCYCEASEAKMGMYEKAGFVKVSDFSCRFGGQVIDETLVMVRKPKENGGTSKETKSASKAKATGKEIASKERGKE